MSKQDIKAILERQDMSNKLHPLGTYKANNCKKSFLMHFDPDAWAFVLSK